MPSDDILRLTQLYQARPDIFTPEQRDKLAEYAKAEGVDFQPVQTPEEQSSNIFSQFASGLFTGFSTAPGWAYEPKDTAQMIAADLGQLVGFAGGLALLGPIGKGIGLAGKASAAVLGESASFLTRGLLTTGEAVVGLSKLKSIPMYVGDFAVAQGEKYLGMTAAGKAGGWLAEETMKRELLHGAAQLGIASAVGADFILKPELDKRWSALWQGALMGAEFKVIGNYVFAKKSPLDLAKIFEDPKTAQIANTTARAASTALFLGLPASLSGQPLELQVYEYAKGALFGAGEITRHQRYAAEVMKKYAKMGPFGFLQLMNGEKLEEWPGMSQEAKDEVTQQSTLHWGQLIRNYDVVRGRMEEVSEAAALTAGAEYDALAKMLKEIDNSDGLGIQRLAEKLKLPEEYVRLALVGEEANAIYEKAKAESLKAKLDANPKANLEEQDQIFHEAVADGLKASKETLGERAQTLFNTPLRPGEARYQLRAVAAETLDRIVAIGQYHDLRAYMDDHEQPLALARPLEDLSRTIVQRDISRETDRTLAEEKNAQSGTLTYETTRRLIDLMAEAREGGVRPFQTFVQRVRDSFNVKLDPTDSDYQTLRQKWVQAFSTSPAKLAVYTPEGYTELQGATLRGKRYDVVMGKSRLEADDLFGSLIHVPVASVNPDSGVMLPLHDADNSWVNEAAMTYYAWKRKTPLLGGLKAEDRIVLAGDYHLDLRDEETRGFNTQTILDDWTMSRGEAMQPVLQGKLEGAEQRYVDLARKDSSLKEVPEEELRQSYRETTANMLAALKTLNGTASMADFLTKSKNFIVGSAALNKRFQVLFAGEVPLDREFFEGIRGMEDGRMRYIIAKSTGSGDDHWLWRKSEADPNIAERYSSKVGRDGGVFYRSDVFRAAAMSIGADPRSGFLKGTAVHAGADVGSDGMFLSKRGIHIADDELNQWMFKMGIHAIEFDTTAKQRGNRALTDVRYEFGGKGHYVEGQTNIYSMPLEATRMNMTVKEDIRSQLANQHLPLQVPSALTKHQGAAEAMAGYRRFQESIHRGDETMNGKAAEYLKLRTGRTAFAQHEKTTLQTLVKEIDVEKLGSKQIIDILQGDVVEESALYTKVINHILKKYKDPIFRRLTDEDSLDNAGLEQELTTLTSASQKILALWDATPATMHHVWSATYVEQAITGFLRGRLVRPVMPGSMKAYMTPHSWSLRAKYGVQEGTYMLGRAARAKEVYYDGEYRKLGEVWDEYQDMKKALADIPLLRQNKDINPRELDKREAELKPILAQMERAMTHAVVRVPMDSSSGLRMLRFAGFTEANGTGIVLHDLDMARMGGADTDADSAFIFSYLPEGMKEFYSRPEIAEEWFYKLKDKDGVEQRVMIDGKSDTQDWTVPRDLMDEDPDLMFDPVSLYRAGKDAAQGNKNLGAAVNLKRALLEIVDGVPAEGVRRRMDDGQYYRIVPSPELLRASGRQGVNFSADSGDGFALIGPDRMRELLQEKAFRVFTEGPGPSEKDQLIARQEDLRGHLTYLEKLIQKLRTEPGASTAADQIALTKIISGGQTGADRAGLEEARALGLATGGTAPRGWRTERGPDVTLKEFGLTEHTSPNYGPRTVKNVEDSDGTVWFGKPTSPGGKLTLRTAAEKKKPVIVNPTGAELRAWLNEHGIRTLNVAGNRAETNPEVVGQTRKALREAYHNVGDAGPLDAKRKFELEVALKDQADSQAEAAALEQALTTASTTPLGPVEVTGATKDMVLARTAFFKTNKYLTTLTAAINGYEYVDMGPGTAPLRRRVDGPTSYAIIREAMAKENLRRKGFAAVENSFFHAGELLGELQPSERPFTWTAKETAERVRKMFTDVVNPPPGASAEEKFQANLLKLFTRREAITLNQDLEFDTVHYNEKDIPWDELPVHFRRRFMEDMLSQDGSDIAGALFRMERGIAAMGEVSQVIRTPKGGLNTNIDWKPFIRTLAEVNRDIRLGVTPKGAKLTNFEFLNQWVDHWLTRNNVRLEHIRGANAKGKYIRTDINQTKLRDEAYRLWKALPNDRVRSYFESLLVTSLRAQELRFTDVMGKGLRDFDSAYSRLHEMAQLLEDGGDLEGWTAKHPVFAWFRRLAKEAIGRGEVSARRPDEAWKDYYSRVLTEELIPKQPWKAWKAEYLTEVGKQWHRTNAGQSGVNLDFIQPGTIERYGTLYNQVLRSFRYGATEEGMRALFTVAEPTETFKKLEPDPVVQAAATEVPQAVFKPKDIIDKVGGTRVTVEGGPKAAEEPPKSEPAVPPLTEADTRSWWASVYRWRDLTPRDHKLRQDMAEVFYHTPQLIRLTEGLIGGEMMRVHGAALHPTALTKPDLEWLIEQFKYGNGEWYWDYAKRVGAPRASWRDYFSFPDRQREKHQPFDMTSVKEVRRWKVITPEGLKEGDVYQFTNSIANMHEMNQRMVGLKDNAHNAAQERNSKRWNYVFQTEGGLELYMIAGRLREAARDKQEGTEKTGVYRKRWEKAKQLYHDRFKDGEEFVYVPGAKGKDRVKAKDFLERIDRDMTLYAMEAQKRVYDEQAVEEALRPYRIGTSGWFNMRSLLGEVMKRVMNHEQIDQYSGGLWMWMDHQILVEKFKAQLIATHRAATGLTDEQWKKYALANTRVPDAAKTPERLLSLPIEIPLGEIPNKEFASEVLKRLQENPKLAFLQFKPPEFIPASEYVPHNGHLEEDLAKYVKRQQEVLSGADVGTRYAAERDAQADVVEKNLPELGIIQRLMDLHEVKELTEERVRELGLHQGMHMTERRSTLAGPVEGWDESPNQWRTYDSQLVRSIYNMATAVFSHETIKHMERTQPYGAETQGWIRYMQDVTRAALGAPTLYSSDFLKDPAFKVTNNPAMAFTDEKHFQWMKKWYGDKAGGRAWRGGAGIQIDKELAFLTALDKKRAEQEHAGNIITAEQTLARALELDQQFGESPATEKLRIALRQAKAAPVAYTPRETLYKQAERNAKADFARSIAWISNLEGKYELMTLLTHTKTPIANIFGGTQNDIIDVGFGHWKRAGSFAYLKNTLFAEDKNVQSMADIQRIAEQHGGLESFINDMAMRGVVPRETFRRYMEEVNARKAKGEPIDGKTLWQIARRHGLTERFMELSSFFMRKSEQIIRRRSFMAHLLSWREVLEGNAKTLPYDDPMLLELAGRGVEASQFLYNNATRPLFASTHLGRIFSRFQLWAWNSAKFRTAVTREAAAYHYLPGTRQFERFKRMMISDLFLMGIAGLYPASMFGAQMPAPWSYFQDLADFFFGTSKEKDKAFYGTLPYPLNITKVIMPPSGRLLDPVFLALTGGDFHKWAGYTVWTLFPFGRMARAVGKTLENPTMVAENMTGFPLHQLQQQKRHSRGQLMGTPLTGYASSLAMMKGYRIGLPPEPELQLDISP